MVIGAESGWEGRGIGLTIFWVIDKCLEGKCFVETQRREKVES